MIDALNRKQSMQKRAFPITWWLGNLAGWDEVLFLVPTPEIIHFTLKSH